MARKQGQPRVCLDYLTKIQAIHSLPVVDCFQRIIQQAKCYLQLGSRPDLQEVQYLCVRRSTYLL